MVKVFVYIQVLPTGVAPSQHLPKTQANAQLSVLAVY